MRTIRPEPGKVPRGTLRQIWRQAFEPHEVEAIAARLKDQMRVPVSAATCRLDPSEFDRLDLGSAQPESRTTGVARGFHARRRAGESLRSAFVAPAVRVGDVIFAGGKLLPLDQATDSLLVTQVYAQRLRDIADQEAEREGVADAWALHLACREGFDPPPEPAVVYGKLIDKLRRQNRNRWMRTVEHARSLVGNLGAREIFGVDYVRANGFSAWQINPLVWVINFQWFAVRPCGLIRRLEGGTLERKTA